jgi:hypothetical protein
MQPKKTQAKQQEPDLLKAPSYSGNIESIRITKKGLTDDYKPYMPEELTASAKKALNYSLTMIMGHVADFHTLVLYILSKKYGHSIEEMIDCVMDHPDAKNLTKHPILRDLWCNFTENDIPEDLQRHPDGLHVDEPPAPYYFSEAAKKAADAVTANAATEEETAETTAKKAVREYDSEAAKKDKKAVTATQAVKKTKFVKLTSKQKDKPKSKIGDIFASSDEE